MKKYLLSSLLFFSLTPIAAYIENIDDWSADSASTVGLSTVVGAAIPSYLVYWCLDGNMKYGIDKYIVGSAGLIGGLIGYGIAYWHMPEVRFNRALSIIQSEKNEPWFRLFEEAQSIAAIWAMVDDRFFETKYPRISGVLRIEGLYNSLIDCITLLEKAVAAESRRFIPDEYIIKHGKQLIEQAQGYLAHAKRWIIELRNDQSYLMQKNAYAAEMAADAARRAAFNSALSALNSGPHYHYHRYW